MRPRPTSARTAARLAISTESISRQIGRLTGAMNTEFPGWSDIGRVVGARNWIRSPAAAPEAGGTVS